MSYVVNHVQQVSSSKNSCCGDVIYIYLSGDSSVLSAQFYPPIKFEDDADYVIGLVKFKAYNSITDVDFQNNRFYFDNGDKILEIPEGSYEVEDINTHINYYLSQNSIDTNKNTLKNFRSVDSIGRLSITELRINKYNISDNPIKIQKVNVICEYSPV